MKLIHSEIHVVRAGETWDAIAERHGITPDELWELNTDPSLRGTQVAIEREKRGRELVAHEGLRVPLWTIEPHEQMDLRIYVQPGGCLEISQQPDNDELEPDLVHICNWPAILPQIRSLIEQRQSSARYFGEK